MADVILPDAMAPIILLLRSEYRSWCGKYQADFHNAEGDTGEQYFALHSQLDTDRSSNALAETITVSEAPEKSFRHGTWFRLGVASVAKAHSFIFSKVNRGRRK
jgi:hypothetical protein